MARAFGISDRVIGLTVVAVGTSLPELATSLIAAWRGSSDLAVGNVIGSNIFNVVLCLGGAATVRPVPGRLSELSVDLLMLGALTVVGAFLMRRERLMHRAEGAFLVVSYAVFLVALAVTA